MFSDLIKTDITKQELLPQSGSNRKYYRLHLADGRTLIGVESDNSTENNTFIEFTKAMKQQLLNVPEIVAVNTEKTLYVQTDLGTVQLYDFLLKEKSENGGQFTDRLTGIYKNVLDKLKEFQTKAAKTVDFGLCYPRAAFDKRSMDWDLQYFKYYFLRLAQIPFNEEALEENFEKLEEFLLKAPMEFFLYRDFQSRNIMLEDGTLTPWFIDYQGGRRGARHYDVASLLFDGKADIPYNIREKLARYFFGAEYDKEESMYQGFILIRILQAMGAYGYRGFFERKTHFLLSIPYALKNISYLLENWKIGVELPTLKDLLTQLSQSQRLRDIAAEAKKRLTVCVSSFSYKHAIPTDNSGNGGGFVFDCRALPNPGRYEQYKKLTGKDKEVIEFFADHREPMEQYLTSVKKLVAQSVEMYMSRGFTNLMVSFGCTGGQHRSVFCAEQTAAWLKETYDVNVTLRHWEQEK